MASPKDAVQPPLFHGFYSVDDDGPPPALPHRSSYDLNSKIMLTAIVSLSFVIVVVIALHIYARCVLRRQERRRAIIRSLGLSVPDVHSDEPPKTGLDPSVIAFLPIFMFKQNGNNQDDVDEAVSMECAVCLSMFEDQEMARMLPNCKHTFHAECIDKWLTSRSTCPICRTEAEPRIQPELREGPAGGAAAAIAPPLERVMNSTVICIEGTSSSSSASADGGIQSSAKVITNSSSRLSSFRRMLSRERSSRRMQYDVQEEIVEDLERQ